MPKAEDFEVLIMTLSCEDRHVVLKSWRCRPFRTRYKKTWSVPRPVYRLVGLAIANSPAF